MAHSGLIRRKATTFKKYVFSERVIPIIKGTIAYLLALILIFINPFDSLLPTIPAAYTSMLIVTIAGFPGKSIGTCLQSAFFALLGISLGGLAFLILAALSHSPVGQGFFFAFFVYLMALLKARSQRWFACALLAILMGFNGIYTSILNRNQFSTLYLKDYLVAYCWGAAITIGVNVLFIPVSSEKELRKTLRTSLEHVATLAHLLAKKYRCDLSDSDKVALDRLAQAIRADFGFLQTKIDETSVEINWSYYSMKDYRTFVSCIRGMQQSLITAHSSLGGVDDGSSGLFREKFLPGTRESFCRLRRAVDLNIRSVGTQLGVKPLNVPATQAGYVEFMTQATSTRSQSQAQSAKDLESGGVSGAESFIQQNEEGGLNWETEEALQEVARRLEEENEMDFRKLESGSEGGGGTREAAETDAHDGTTAIHTPQSPQPGVKLDEQAQTGTFSAPFFSGKNAEGFDYEQEKIILRDLPLEYQLKPLFDTFCERQHDIFTEVLMSGKLHGEDKCLRVNEPLPSLHTMFGPDLPYGMYDDAPVLRNRKRVINPDAEGDGTTETEDTDEKRASESRHTLLRVYGFIFAMGQFITNLETLLQASKRTNRKIHVHLFESFHRPHAGTEVEGEIQTEMPLAEAVALMEGREYVPKRTTVLEKLIKAEQLLRTPTSIYAAKTAGAVSVFTLLILVKKPQSWFINYGLTGGLLTIVVALAPTLGQSITTFVFQIAGSGIGYIYGMIVLEIFHNVGGYTYNPFGIICLLIPYTLWMCYVLYEKPKFFVISLLALNATGVLCATEWVQREHLHRIFDGAPLRAGKSLAALCVALAIVGVFQLFILRNPAQRTLRKRIAGALSNTLSLMTLMQAYARAAIPTDPERRVDSAILRRVEKELLHRELVIQRELISLQPLVLFASAEPHYIRPFRADLLRKIMTTNQIILDRLREGRTALGSERIDNTIITNFVAPLSTYRRLSFRIMKNTMYLVSTSLATKTPMPHETLTVYSRLKDFFHDALVISTRFARDPDRAKTIRDGSFLRYWAYLMCVTNIQEQLNILESTTKELMGELEAKLL